MASVLVFPALALRPHARASASRATPDWLFPRPETSKRLRPEWRPLFLDYLFLGYTTATAFGPADALPLTRRAKMSMMLESAISLATTVIVLSRAVNTIPG